MSGEDTVEAIIEAWAQDEKEHLPGCNKSDRATVKSPCNCGLSKVRREQAEKIVEQKR